MKKMIAGLLVVILTGLLFTGHALAHEDVAPKAKRVGNECILIDNSGMPTSFAFPNDIKQPKAVLRSNVTVIAKCLYDQPWRTLYGNNWSGNIFTIVGNADNALTENFGIEISPMVMSTACTTPINSSDFLSILQAAGFVYNAGYGNQIADVMLGFSGISEVENGSNIAGRARYEQPYCCILDRGSRNTESLQHEIGHMYGLARTSSTHCTNNCVMTSTGWGYLGQICSSCATYWDLQKNRY